MTDSEAKKRPSRPLGLFVSGRDSASGSGASTRPSESFEDMLADPTFQTPFDTELLPHLLAFGPPDLHVHAYGRQPNGTTACSCGEVLRSNTAAAWPTRSDPERQFGDTGTSANGGAE